MINSFQTIIARLNSRTQSLKWTTDTGRNLSGVLYLEGNTLILNIDPSTLEENLYYSYIYYEDSSGNRRTIYPYPNITHFIPSGRESTTWPIVVFAYEETPKESIAPMEKTSTITFESFLHFRVPESSGEKRAFRDLINQLSNLETTLGKISVNLPETNSYSTLPSKNETSMSEISISIERDGNFTHSEILMWHARFHQYLSMLNKERLVTTSIQLHSSNILIPQLLESYNRGNYGYRNVITLEEFVSVAKSSLIQFIDGYDELAGLIEDISMYYYDYPSDPPDKIQLLRLFTSLEQCSNHAQRVEQSLKNAMTDEQTLRSEEFNSFMAEVQKLPGISAELKTYLRDKTKVFYISSGSQAAPKHKIVGLARFLSENYEISSQLQHIPNVELALKMRNIVAHGFYDPNIVKEFYSKRDILGQDIERCIRAYIFHAIGLSPSDIVRNCDPLRARQFNS